MKLKFSEDLSCIIISNICEKLNILNDAILIVQTPLFNQQKLNLIYDFMFKQYLYHQR